MELFFLLIELSYHMLNWTAHVKYGREGCLNVRSGEIRQQSIEQEYKLKIVLQVTNNGQIYFFKQWF